MWTTFMCFLEAWKLQIIELFSLLMASFHNRKTCRNLKLIFDIYRLLYSHLYTGWRTGECHGVSSCSESTDGHQSWPWHNLDRGVYGQCGECMTFQKNWNADSPFHKFHFQLCLSHFNVFWCDFVVLFTHILLFLY